MNLFTQSITAEDKLTVATKRNDPRLNNHQRLQLQGWRANCDIQPVIDYHACVEYLAKYAAKTESRSNLLKHVFRTIVSNSLHTATAGSIVKQTAMKALGQRDFSSQETMHHLLSLDFLSTSFKVISANLNGSRRIDLTKTLDYATKNSLLDIYATRQQYQTTQTGNLKDMNFVTFASKYKLVNNKLTNQPKNVVPRVFPTYSSSTKGPHFGLYCKYQLLKYKPWLIRQENAWGDREGSDEVYISEWEKFLQSEYAHNTVPDWNTKLEDIQGLILNEEPSDEPNPSSNLRKEWMILADLTFTTSDSMEEEQIQYDWHTTSFPYTNQQISEMPSWLTKQKQTFTTDRQSNGDEVDIGTFSSMQSLAYDLVQEHFNSPIPRSALHLIINGVAGTGKSYLISAFKSLLQRSCVVSATTGKAAFSINGITIHSLLNLPVGPRGKKDLTGQSLARYQICLN